MLQHIKLNKKTKKIFIVIYCIIYFQFVFPQLLFVFIRWQLFYFYFVLHCVSLFLFVYSFISTFIQSVIHLVSPFLRCCSCSPYLNTNRTQFIAQHARGSYCFSFTNINKNKKKHCCLFILVVIAVATIVENTYCVCST